MVAGIISVGICTFIAAVMAHAGGVVLNDIFGLPQFYSALIIVGVTTLYTTFGGLRASVITDAFQFTAFAILLPAAFLWIVVFHQETSTINLVEQTSSITAQGHGPTAIEIVGLIAAFLLGETLIPPYTNRALASKTTGVSRNGFILAGFFSIAWFAVMVALGIIARGIIAADTPEEHVLLVLFKTTMPAAGYTLLLLVLVSVIMSSLDSLLNAGAVVLTQDIVKPFAQINDAASLNIGRGATIAIAAVAAACVPAVPSIIGGLLICYTIWASAILPAAIIGLWLKNPRPFAGFLSMSIGTVSAIIAIAIVFISAFEIDTPVTIIPALGAALAAYLIGHRIGKSNSGA
jgi:SSS family solute:Na+ symporter